MTRAVIWLGILLVVGLWFVERQVTAFAFTATAGATGILEREDEAVPFTLFDEASVPRGHAFIAGGRWVPFGVGYTLQLPDRRQVAFTYRGGTATADDGWSVRFGTPAT